uniref:Uncharacterized protein n=1 Tax=Anguilla anguilla TaxID=7936 RepID=A0A0E9X8U7_ANGAN
MFMKLTNVITQNNVQIIMIVRLTLVICDIKCFFLLCQKIFYGISLNKESCIA